MRVASTAFALAVSLIVAGNVLAADDQPVKEGHNVHQAGGDFAPGVFPDRMLNSLNLTADQKAKVDELKKEYDPKVKANQEKAQSILTPDQKKGREDAVAAAKAAGKKGREVFEAGRAAMNLTEDQKTQLAQVRKDGAAIRKEAREKLSALLTPEQQKELTKKGRHGNRGEGGN